MNLFSLYLKNLSWISSLDMYRIIKRFYLSVTIDFFVSMNLCVYIYCCSLDITCLKGSLGQCIDKKRYPWLFLLSLKILDIGGIFPTKILLPRIMVIRSKLFQTMNVYIATKWGHFVGLICTQHIHVHS